VTVDRRAPSWPGNRPSLDERRAVFVYEAARLHADASSSHVVPPPWHRREQAFKDQFVRTVRTMCSEDRKTDPAELHDDWMEAYEAMGWVYGPVRDPDAKTHPDMVPFDDLHPREQAKDTVFIALTEIARLWITDEEDRP
jgi:hypothetical protein